MGLFPDMHMDRKKVMTHKHDTLQIEPNPDPPTYEDQPPTFREATAHCSTRRAKPNLFFPTGGGSHSTHTIVFHHSYLNTNNDNDNDNETDPKNKNKDNDENKDKNPLRHDVDPRPIAHIYNPKPSVAPPTCTYCTIPLTENERNDGPTL